ncbi:MAG: hypothetical protein KGJ13_09995 [Patescibacteria group bacterium]|nr:hypothetical protein [Patescibacteria group bacterium]
MATRKPKAPAIDALVDSAQEPDYIDFDTLNPALEQIKADLNITGDADVDCHVSLLNADGAGNEYKVWQGDPDQYDLEKIAKQHGTGQYRIMVYMKIPSGHKVRKLNKVQGWKLSADDEAALALKKNPPPEKSGDGGNAIATMMVQGFQQLGELIVKATQKPEVDPLKQMEALAGIMRTVMPPAVAPVSAQPNFMELLNMVKLFNEATGANAPKLPEGTDSSTALMMAGMDMFKPVIAKAMEQKVAQAPAAVAPAQPALPAPEAQAAQPESEDFMLFKLQLKAANKAAANKADPADFADTIFNILPDEVLHGMAFDPAWFSYLVKAVPECEPHKAWYEAVRNALIEIAVEDGVFVRGADGGLTLAPEDGHNAANPIPDAANAAGKPPAS